LLIINLISFHSSSKELNDCSLPVVNNIKPTDSDIIGKWYYQLSNENYKEWKVCHFKADHTYSCKVHEQGLIDKSKILFESELYLTSGNWKIDGETFVFWVPYKIVSFSKNSFKIQNEAGYSEMFFKNKTCVSSL